MYIVTGYLPGRGSGRSDRQESRQFDPLKNHPFPHTPTSGGVNRGAYWSDGLPDGERRIIHGTADGRLFSLDAKTGQLDPKFADADSQPRKELDPSVGRRSVTDRRRHRRSGRTRSSSAFRGEGLWIAARGDIRAFDVRTGRAGLAISHRAPAGRIRSRDLEKATPGKWRARRTPGVGFSIDQERGLVFADFGPAAFDFTAVIGPATTCSPTARLRFDAKTAQAVWHFQTLRHDLWDHDRPVYPEPGHGQPRREVDRRCGTGDEDGPRLPVRPRDGQAAFRREGSARPWPRTSPANRPRRRSRFRSSRPLSPSQFLDESNVTNIGESNRARFSPGCVRSEGPGVQPPSLQGTVVIPGFHGGANWSGASFDPTTGLLYVNSNNVPNIITLRGSEAGQALRGTERSTTRGTFRFKTMRATRRSSPLGAS